MRYLFICLTILFTSPAHAICTNGGCEDGTLLPSIGEQTLKRVDAFGSWASDSLEQLAEKLGTTVEYLWPTFVKQVVANNVASAGKGVFLMFLSVIFFAVFAKISRVSAKDALPGSDEKFNAAVAGGFKWVVLIALLIWGGFLILNSVPGLIAPEPEALNNLMSALKALKG